MAEENIIGGGRRDGDEYIPEESGAQLVERDTSRTALGIEDTDLLLHMAETADKRADAYKKIKLAALRLTTAADWVDQGGNPYLLAPGAEKVADIFRLSWRIARSVTKTMTGAGGHFIMSCTLIIRAPWGREIEVVGTRSSSDPFYAKKGEDIRLLEEIDEADVAKGAYTNAEVGAITRILGLRGLTYEDLERSGIKKADMKRVDYRSAQAAVTPDETEKQRKLKQMLVEINNGSEAAAVDQLEKISAFKDVKGVRDFGRLRGTRLDVNLSKAEGLYATFQRAAATGHALEDKQ